MMNHAAGRNESPITATYTLVLHRAPASAKYIELFSGNYVNKKVIVPSFLPL